MTTTMRARTGFSRLPAALILAGALLALGACSGDKPRFLTDVMAPAGSTPEQIRTFCTTLGDEAADYNFLGDDPLARSLRARDQTFAACMARHHIAP
jgi:hypothetical protein